MKALHFSEWPPPLMRAAFWLLYWAAVFLVLELRPRPLLAGAYMLAAILDHVTEEHILPWLHQEERRPVEVAQLWIMVAAPWVVCLLVRAA